YAKDVSGGERLMSYEDFINHYLGLGISDGNVVQLLGSCADNSKKGAISFKEFCALELLLSSADASYKLAFRLFDTDGKGVVTFDQFRQILSSTLTNRIAPFNFDGEFVKRYFGEKKNRQITYLEFSEMAKHLRHELNMQIFKQYDNDSTGTITGHAFTELMLETKKELLSTHIKQNLPKIVGSLPSDKVNFAYYSAFIDLLSNIDVIEEIFTRAAEDLGKDSITKEEFLQTSRLYSQITPFEVDILYRLCEVDNGKGHIGRSDIQHLVPENLQNFPNNKATNITPTSQEAAVRFFTDVAESVYRFALGSVAGAVGATAVYPIDLVKTRLQNQRGKLVGELMYKNSLDCFVRVVKVEGFFGLYRGLLPQFIGVAPEKAIKLTMNDLLRDKLKTKKGELPLLNEIIAGGTAGGCQVVFTNPLEIVKIRLQVAGEVPGLRLGAVQVIRDLGLTGLYKGARACFLRDIPFSAIYFPAYAHLKPVFADKNGSNGPTSLLAAAALAGAPAASLSTPADVIKTRLQVQARKGQTTYDGIIDCTRKLMKQEGFRAFWKGAPARVFRSSPQFGVTLVTYELLQRYLYVDFGGTAPSGSPMALAQQSLPASSQSHYISGNPDHIGGMKLAVASFVGLETKFGLTLPKFKLPS
ncbi:uncharacterized protein TRIADDRAFT_21712, partial [Trichoplax adhaerens]